MAAVVFESINLGEFTSETYKLTKCGE